MQLYCIDILLTFSLSLAITQHVALSHHSGFFFSLIIDSDLMEKICGESEELCLFQIRNGLADHILLSYAKMVLHIDGK